MTTQPLPEMSDREWERFIVQAMKADGWDQIPEVGLKLKHCFPMIAAYIDFLRKAAYAGKKRKDSK